MKSRDRLEQSARQVEKSINRLGFAARTETINTPGCLPGQLAGARCRKYAPSAYQYDESGRLATDKHDLDRKRRCPLSDVSAFVTGSHALCYQWINAVPFEPPRS